MPFFPSGFLLQYGSSGLLALLGIAVPVAIHLWNRRPGRTVRVGSVRWLNAAANRRLRSLQLEQWRLLLLRALLVALLALVVAGPGWQEAPLPLRGQVLLSPALLHSASLLAVRAEVDSLRQQGYELRELAPGLRHLSSAAWRRLDSLAATQTGPGRAGPDALPADNLWARVAQAADSLPGRPLRVFTPPGQRWFAGNRPPLPARVTWQTVPVADSGRWLQAVTQVRDSLHLVLGQGDEAATWFRTVRLAVPRAATASLTVPGLPPVQYRRDAAGRAGLRVAPDTTTHAVMTTPVALYIYHDAAHAADARYLAAALRAAGLGLGLPPRLTVAPVPPPAAAPLTWLFWLSAAPVPAHWQQRVPQGMQLWQDAPAPGVATLVTLTLPDPAAAPIRLLRRDTLATKNDVPLWTDGFGRPVLTSRAQGRGLVYHLHTRLHPAWSELTDRAELPALLLPLLQGRPAAARADYRSLASRQIQVAADPATPPRAAAPVVAERGNVADLRPWLVLLIGLLFGLERWLARRASSFTPAV